MAARRMAFLIVVLLCGESARAQPSQPRVEFVTQLGHRDRILSITVSPDGALALSTSLDGSVRLWHLESGALLRILATDGRPGGAAFLPDGKRAITSAEGGIQIWDLATGTVQRRFGGPTEKLALSADGKRVVVHDFRQKVGIWDVDKGTLVYGFERPAVMFDGLALSSDGKLLALASRDKSIRILDASSGAVVRKLDHAAKGVAFSPSGTTLAFTGADKALRLVDAASGKLLWTTPDADKWAVWTVRFSSDGRRLLTTGTISRAATWDAATGARLNDFFVLHDGGTAALSPDAKQVLVSDGPALALFDANGKTPSRVIRGRTVEGFAAAFSSDGKRILAASGEHAFAEWDLEELRRVRTFVGHKEIVREVAASPDGKMFASGSGGISAVSAGDTSVRLWDASTGRELRALSGHTSSVSTLAFSPDGKRLVTGGRDKTLRLWDPSNGAQLHTIKLEPNSWNSVRFFPDGKRIVAGPFESGGTTHAIHIFDLETGKLATKLSGHKSEVFRVAVSPDGKRILSGHGDKRARLWDVDAGKPVFTWDHGGSVTAVALTPDGKRAITSGADPVILVWDVQTGKQVRRLEGHGAIVRNLVVSPDGRFLLSASQDGTHRLWRLDTGAWIALVSLDGEWLVYDETGRFDASRKGGELVAIVRGLRAFRVDQLAAVRNRPDLILATLGVGSPELRQHFRARAQRRTERLGIAPDAVDGALDRAPDARITSASQSGDTATLSAELRDAARLLRYNIYVNNVPLFGALGKPVAGAHATISEAIALAPGTNRIEVAALNSEGVGSLRAVRVLGVPAAPVRRRLYFVGFGVSRYRDARLDLKYAHKDALDLAHLFGSMTGAFAEVRVKAFVNEQVTVAAIRSARELVKDARPEDVVVVFVAGHGTHASDAAARYYFITHETDPDRLADTAADFDLIEELVDATPARNKLLLLDTCESGDLDEPDQVTAIASAGQRGLRSRGTRALVRVKAGAPVAARRYLYDRERYIYNDLTRRTGAIVFSASRGSELSFELDELKNGVFTKAIVAALTTDDADGNKDGAVTSDELRAYVSAAVSRRTDDLQHPVVDRDNPDQLITFAIARGLAFPEVALGEAAPAPPAPAAPELPAPTAAPPQVRGPRGCACGAGGSDGLLGGLTIAVVLGLPRRRRRPPRS